MRQPLSFLAKFCLNGMLLAATAWAQAEAEWRIDTIAGTGREDYSGDGGPAVAASLNLPKSVAVDSAGNLYIADLGNSRIRRVDARGIITTVAGTGITSYSSGDGGPAIQANLALPDGVAVDSAGNLYIADLGNSRIRRVDARGIITTIAGTGTRGYSGDGGPAAQAKLDRPSRVAVDSAGNVYVADSPNHRIRILMRPPPLPNLTPYRPHDWSDKIVVSKLQDTHIDSSELRTSDRLYVDFAVINDGSSPVTEDFQVNLLVDSRLLQTFTSRRSSPRPLKADYHAFWEDHSIGNLSAGPHTLTIVADAGNSISESNESDNQYSKTIAVTGAGTCFPLITNVSPQGAGTVAESRIVAVQPPPGAASPAVMMTSTHSRTS